MELISRGGKRTVAPKYYPGTENKKSFITLPAEYVKPTEKVNGYSRVVAFGAVADAVNAAIQKGLKTLTPKKVSLRDNSFEGVTGTIEQTDLVCHSVRIGKKLVQDEFAISGASDPF